MAKSEYYSATFKKKLPREVLGKQGSNKGFVAISI